MKISIQTSLDGLAEVEEALNTLGECTAPAEVAYELCKADARDADAIFTNPNNLGFRYDSAFLSSCEKLKYFVTASTGTNHVDLKELERLGIQLFCLRNEPEFMSQVTATAEHAMCLTLAAARKLPTAFANIENAAWSWENCVGRQISSLNAGVVGFGRLGKLYTRYIGAIAKQVQWHDPYLSSEFDCAERAHDLGAFLEASDILAIHIHADASNYDWLNADKLARMKSSVIIVNTSRGDVVDEEALAGFLRENPEAIYATDVLKGEFDGFPVSPLFAPELKDQVIVTPHIGGMARESRLLAYGRVVTLFKQALGDG